MTCKQPLYALAAALLLAPPALAGPGGGAPQGPAAPPCGACITLGVSAAASASVTGEGPLALVAGPDELGSIPSGNWTALGAAIVDLHGADGDLDRLDLAARKSLTDARSRRPGLRLGALGPAATLDALLARDLAAYVDFVAVDALDEATRARWVRAHPGLSIWRTTRLESFATVLGESVRAAGERLLVWPAPPITRGLLDDLARLAGFFPEALVELPGAGATCEPAAVCEVRTFERPETQERIFWIARRSPARSARPEDNGRAAIVIPALRAELAAVSTNVGAAPGVADSVLPLAPQIADASGRLRLYLPLTGVSSLILRVPAAQARVIEEVRVVGARELTVEEIIARHQAQAARQQALVRTLVTHADTTLTFEVPAFPAPVAIQAETVVLQGDGPTELIQQRVRVNGVALGESGTPRLPIVEPERVAAPPLAIALSRSYRYRLEGRARVNASDAYIVAFEPRDRHASLFQGRAWIDAASFALVRADAAQTGLHGPITASQQIDEFRPEPIGTERVWLLAESETRQVYQGAGVATPILRVMRVRRHEVNAPDFERRRRAAYASSDLMLRDTPGGLRYLRRENGGGPGRDAVRVVAGRATKIRTLAGGVIVDPNITRPLPFAGLNYTDFDLAGTGAQLNAFFGGTYGQVAFDAPSIGGSRWQMVGGGFAMLASYHDRAFRGGRERYEENLRQRPVHASAGVVRPLTPRTTARAEYVFDLTVFDAADTTSSSFAVPGRQVVHAARVALETQRGGWRIEAWWNPGRRSGWREWGFAGSGEYDPGHATFQRFGASVSRPWVLTPRWLARLEVAAMGGADLDRFSRYAFGTFDNRLRGYPSASIRYDRGAVARGAIVWQPSARLRLDGFADAALVREPGFGRAARGYPGIGAAIEAPGPFSLLLGAEWGYGPKGINADGSRGTHVVRITAYKVF